MFDKLVIGTDRRVLSARASAALLLFLVGSFLIYGVGFAHSYVLHNAAHDVRHTMSFPCH